MGARHALSIRSTRRVTPLLLSSTESSTPRKATEAAFLKAARPLGVMTA